MMARLRETRREGREAEVAINISSDFDPDDMFREFNEQVGADMVERFAQDLASKARARGEGNVDSFDVDFTKDGDPEDEIPIDAEAIRARANAILRGE